MKKIRKNYSGVVPNGKVLNSRNNSLQDTYSSDYLNRAIPDTKNLGPIIVDSIECKNLFNKNSFIKIMSYLDTTTGLITENVHNHTLFIKCSPNTTYTIQKMLSGVFAVGYINEEPAIGVKAYSIKNDNNLASITITTGSESKYLAVRYYHNTVDTQYTEQQVLSSIQVEKGSVATNYVPYKEFENNDIYSENEIRIGTWINGKPLYRKVINFGTLPNTTTKTVPTGASNIDMLTELRAIGFSSYGFLKIPTVTIDAIEKQITLYYDKSKNEIQIITGSNRSSIQCYVIIEYTKTTD